MEEGLLVEGERKMVEVEVREVPVEVERKMAEVEVLEVPVEVEQKAFSCLGEPEVSSLLVEGVLS